MTFAPGAFYKRKANGTAYKCESISDYRALLYLCQRLKSEKDEPKRLRIDLDAFDEWELVTKSYEYAHLEVIYNHWLKREFEDLQNPYDGILRRQYHLDRYLEGIHPDEKKARYRDAALNSVWLEPDGSMGQLSAADGVMRFLEVTHHLNEDAKLQGYEKDRYKTDRTVETRMGNYLAKKYADPNSIIRHLPDTRLGGIYKYAQSKFAKALFYNGSVRISLATFFKNQEHNAAIQDVDEDKILIRVSRDARNLVIVRDGKEFFKSQESDKMVILELLVQHPSYVFCVSKLLDPRFFFDFDCDAYVFIPNENIPEFARRINEGAKRAIPKCPKMLSTDVVYYDPLRVFDEITDVFHEELLVEKYKDFRYEYQREYRFIWPSLEEPSLLNSYLDIEIGPINDIAELKVLGE